MLRRIYEQRGTNSGKRVGLGSQKIRVGNGKKEVGI